MIGGLVRAFFTLFLISLLYMTSMAIVAFFYSPLYWKAPWLLFCGLFLHVSAVFVGDSLWLAVAWNMSVFFTYSCTERPVDSIYCTVCLGSLGRDVRALWSCGHIFHGRCLRRWLSYDHHCPCCRRAAYHIFG